MTRVEPVVKGGDKILGCGEGPVWEPKTKSLLSVDIEEGDIHRYDSVTKSDSKIHVGKFLFHILFFLHFYTFHFTFLFQLSSIVAVFIRI